MAAVDETTSTREIPPDSTARSHNHLRRHIKKYSDPFLDLLPPDTSSSNAPDPTRPSNGHDEDVKLEPSLLTDLVLTPIRMITFLLALVLVDRQQKSWRLSQHASDSKSIWDRLTDWSLLGPEPYQDPNSAASHDRIDSDDRQPAGTARRAGPFRGWYARTKHRAIVKLEITDAFELRRRVLLVLIAWTVLGLVALAYATRRLYGSFVAWLF